MAPTMNPSGTPLNLLFVNCAPDPSVKEEEWVKWFATEHFAALAESNAIISAALYKEVGFGMIPNPRHSLNYLALYQTDFKRLQESEKYREACQEVDVSGDSEDGVERDEEWEDAGFEDANETRNYRLIQDYNPLHADNKPTPHLLTVNMNPEDRTDFEEWYRTELLPKLSTLPGYKRSRRYQRTNVPDVAEIDHLAVHEIQDLTKAFPSRQAHNEASTPRMEKHIEASKKSKTVKGGGFVQRGWELLYATDLEPNGEIDGQDEGFQSNGPGGAWM